MALQQHRPVRDQTRRRKSNDYWTARNGRDDDDFETIIGRDGKPVRVLRDKGRMRVSFFDSVRSRERWHSQIHDGRGGPLNTAGHRPGFLISDSNRRAIEQAYRDYDQTISRAYLQDDPPAGAYPFAEHLVGTSCTINGAPGTLRRKGDWLVCVPNKQSFSGGEPASDSVKDHRQRMAELYAARDAEDANAWRTGK
jgi:hypothetical protein